MRIQDTHWPFILYDVWPWCSGLVKSQVRQSCVIPVDVEIHHLYWPPLSSCPARTCGKHLIIPNGVVSGKKRDGERGGKGGVVEMLHWHSIVPAIGGGWQLRASCPMEVFVIASIMHPGRCLKYLGSERGKEGEKIANFSSLKWAANPGCSER